MTTYTVTATATTATTNRITVATTDNMFSGMPIVFSGTTFGGITAGATYYIGNINVGYPTSTITVNSLPGGGVYVLTTATGTMTGTFNSGGQQIISTVPPGEPLNESFNSVNLNFDQVFAAGPVGSNIQIANNTLLTTNTNGNLVLAPNGVGVVQSNVSILPNTPNIRSLGSSTQRWSSLYVQYASISGNLDLAGEFSVGDMTVTGNLTVTGNTIQIGNIVTETLTIQLANAAGTANAANGSGITVGANDNIATILYNSTSNTWNTNIGVSAIGNVTGSNVVTGGVVSATGNVRGANLNTVGVISATGNITGNYFIGNGSQLTGLAATYSNANVATFLAAFGSNTISTSGNITGGNILGNIQAADGNTSVMFNQQGFLGADAGFSYDYATNTLYVETATIEGKNTHGDNALYVGVTGFTPLGSNVVAQLAGNADSYTQVNFQNISDSPTASGDYIITANNGTDTTNFIDMGIAGNTWNGTQTNSLGNAVLANDGYLYVNGGNLVVGTYLDSGNVINTWKFDNTGNLNLPTNGDLNFAAGGIKQALNEDLYIRASDDEADGWSIYNVIDDGTGNTLSQTRLEFDQYTIRTDAQGAAYTWAFRDTGVLDLPGDIYGNVGGNLTVKIGDSAGSDTFIDLQTRSYVGDALISNIRIANPNVTVSTANAVYNWTFDSTGNLNLPPSGNIVGVTANNSGYINWLGNSSGDGYGYTTMRLVPDDTVGGDSYLIIDPTAPNHIHIRAGGTQDNSGAQLFLGGENSYFLVENGANSNVYVASNSNQWKFDTTGILTLPGEGVLQSLNDTVTLSSLNTTTGNANSVYLGSSGGLGFFDQEAGGNWLEIFRNGAEPEIRVPVGRGNLNIQTAEGINAYNWTFDNTGNLTLPGNTFAVNYANGTAVSLDGSYGNSNVDTYLSSGTMAANIITTANVTAQNFKGTSANIELVAGSYTWTFDNTGNIQGNIGFTGSDITINNAPGGNEGGELKWALPAPANTVLSGTVVQDVFQNGMRFFESSGNTRGLYMDLGNAPNGTSTAVGYREIPQIALGSNVTANVTDAGRHFYSTTAGNLQITIPDNANVAFPTGATLTVVVNAAGNVVVAQGTGVSLYMAGSSSTGNRTVGAYGLASVMKVATDTWVISGTGVY